MAASGLGLAIGSYLAAPSLAKVGLRRHYSGSIALMAIGLGAAALSPSIWIALPFIVGSSAGNGAAIICNQLLVQRGAPDRFRGRALATIMSSNFAVLGLAMAVTGVLTVSIGARWILLGAATANLLTAVVALQMTRWLPVTATGEEAALGVQAEAAVSHPVPAVEILPPIPKPARDGSARSGMERIAVLLEEIEARRAREATRPGQSMD